MSTIHYTKHSWYATHSFFFGGGLYVFLTQPALPGVPEVWFPVQSTYSLSSFAFKRVTRGSTIKTQFPFPLLLQVHEGAIGRLTYVTNSYNIVIILTHSKQVVNIHQLIEQSTVTSR